MDVLEAHVVFLAVLKLVIKRSGNLKGRLLLLNITGMKRLDGLQVKYNTFGFWGKDFM